MTMIPLPHLAELVADHRRTLLQEAEDHRLAQGAHRHRWHAPASALTLRVRQVRPEDALLLATIFAQLSPASRQARYLIARRELTAPELHYFTDIDHHDHEAVIAVTRLRRKPVGVARFIRDAGNRTSAEVAMEVVDEWQGRGVGSLLARRLAARARHEDIAQLTALMAADNPRPRQLLSKVGAVTAVARDGPTVSYRVALAGATAVPSKHRTRWAVLAGRGR